MAQSPIVDVQFVDDFYFSALSNENEEQMYPISDSKYAEELQLQEALMSSVSSSSSSSSSQSASGSPSFTVGPSLKPAKETGESSHCFCEICVEKKDSDEMFRIDSCTHSFCSDCVTKHVSMKLQENTAVVHCPGWDCRGVLELDACRQRMSDEVLARWDEMLCELLIPAAEKFYCPFKDCSALLVKDGEGEDVQQSECPYCHRLFCARCYVKWHLGVDCDEFQRLNEGERETEDLMVRELAKSKSWMRCPSCRFYVEKTEGCLHITCRCGFQFCYACGATWTTYHGGCRPAA